MEKGEWGFFYKKIKNFNLCFVVKSKTLLWPCTIIGT